MELVSNSIQLVNTSSGGVMSVRCFWCFGGQFLNRPWLVQVVDNCDFRQAPAGAWELLAGAGTDELSEQTQTYSPQLQNQQAGHVVYASQVPPRLLEAGHWSAHHQQHTQTVHAELMLEKYFRCFGALLGNF